MSNPISHPQLQRPRTAGRTAGRLLTMSAADRAFMARRLPRTYRAMRDEIRTACPGDLQPTPDVLRRGSRLLAFDRRRHAEARGRRLSCVATSHMPIGDRTRRTFDRRRDLVCNLVVAQSGFSWQQLVSADRSRDLARARQACMYLLLRHTPLNLSEVGQLFGGRDHTTVLHARDKVAREPKTFNDIIGRVETQLGVS